MKSLFSNKTKINQQLDLKSNEKEIKIKWRLSNNK